MRMREISYADGQPPIDGYGTGGFRIAGAWREGSLILTPAGDHGLVSDTLDLAGLSPLIDAAESIDVVLVGQGPEIRPLPAALRRSIEDAGIGAEVMSTPSACRTYNILLAEGRRVAAVLIAV